MEIELLQQLIDVNNKIIKSTLQSKAQNPFKTWSIKINNCGKILNDAWWKPYDGITKYNQQCNLNFDVNGEYFDSGVAKTNKEIPEWVLDCELNNGKILRFVVKTVEYRYCRIRMRTLKNDFKTLEISGQWAQKNSDHWQPVTGRK